jgi:hypothetical protein
MNIQEFIDQTAEEGLQLVTASFKDIKNAFNDKEKDPLNLKELAMELASKTELNKELASVSSAIVVATVLEQLLSDILTTLKIPTDETDSLT